MAGAVGLGGNPPHPTPHCLKPVSNVTESGPPRPSCAVERKNTLFSSWVSGQVFCVDKVHPNKTASFCKLSLLGDLWSAMQESHHHGHQLFMVLFLPPHLPRVAHGDYRLRAVDLFCKVSGRFMQLFLGYPA